MSSKFRLAAALALIVSMFTATMSASAHHDGGPDYHPIETDEFQNVWNRTDLPVQEMEVARTWIWSPGAHSPLMTEEYAEGENGERQVQYFDKSRMEMPTEGDADTQDEESPWFITQGRLAYELMSGELQLGDDTYEQHHPSHRSAAGDPDDESAPTYEAMGNLMDEDARDTGEIITEFADREGNVTTDEDLADFGVTDAEYDDVTEHNIASVFWDFMNSESTIYEDGEYVVDDLFENPYYAVGRPMTEAYWAWVEVDDEEQHVLIQCFERRCLTYTPGNPEGWQVESGNIGQHYYDWRYNEIDREAPTEGTFTFDGEASALIEVEQGIDLTAHVTSHGENVEDAAVYFQVIDGDEDAVSLDPDRERTDADGNAVVTVTGEAEGSAEVQAFVDLNDNGEYDLETDLGLGVVEVEVVGALPDVSVDASDMDGLDTGESGQIVASLTNAADVDGGMDFDAVTNTIVVDGPEDCDAASEWEDWFEITDIDASGDTQGINDTFVCDEDSGNFVGNWGGDAGFPLTAGYDASTTFDVMVGAEAAEGTYVTSVMVVDVDSGATLATGSDEFDIGASDSD